tara:strand:- start:59 stop:376 length:318 start_codon:yes stop_codon:yes gene_type:complete
MKKFFLFFLFLKVRYNWYKSNYCCIPTLIRSFLYQDPHISFGTIGTILKLVLITNAYLSKFLTFTICSFLQKIQKASNTNKIRGIGLEFFINIFLFYKSRSIQRL